MENGSMREWIDERMEQWEKRTVRGRIDEKKG